MIHRVIFSSKLEATFHSASCCSRPLSFTLSLRSLGVWIYTDCQPGHPRVPLSSSRVVPSYLSYPSSFPLLPISLLLPLVPLLLFLLISLILLLLIFWCFYSFYFSPFPFLSFFSFSLRFYSPPCGLSSLLFLLFLPPSFPFFSSFLSLRPEMV